VNQRNEAGVVDACSIRQRLSYQPTVKKVFAMTEVIRKENKEEEGVTYVSVK